MKQDFGKKEEKPRKTRNYSGEGLAIGVSLGLIVGMYLFDNPALGIALGGAFGLMIGEEIKKQKCEPKNSDENPGSAQKN